MRTAITMLIAVSSTVTGKALAISPSVGLPVHTELPKSPCTTPPRYTRYWT